MNGAPQETSTASFFKGLSNGPKPPLLATVIRVCGSDKPAESPSTSSLSIEGKFASTAFIQLFSKCVKIAMGVKKTINEMKKTKVNVSRVDIKSVGR